MLPTTTMPLLITASTSSPWTMTARTARPWLRLASAAERQVPTTCHA